MSYYSITCSIALYLGCFIVPYVLLCAGYRLFLHPLRVYPGPLLGKLTNAYGGFHALFGNLHLVNYHNHVKYGSVVRQGPNRLVFNTIQALQDIYSNPLVNKSRVYELTRMTPSGNVLDTIDVDAHRRKRKIVSQPISDRAMHTFETTIVEQIDIFISQLEGSLRGLKPVNMTQCCRNLGTDVVGHLAFGYPLKTQTEEDNRWLQDGLALVSFRTNVYLQFPRLAMIEGLVRILIKKGRQRYQHITETMIQARTSLDIDAKHDLYSFAAGSMGSGPLRGSELWAEAFFFIIAGGATTSIAMCGLFFYLSRYPDCYKELAREIRATFSSTTEIHSGEQLQSCKYLRACINESLRMSPPTTAMLWRERLLDNTKSGHSQEPLIIDGHVIPPGTEFAVNLYSLHHNEQYFPNPFVFKPERWLSSSSSESSAYKAFAPFSIGPRSCPGKAMAYLELSLVIAKTLWHFDFVIPPGEEGEVGAGKEGMGYGRGRKREFQLYDRFTATHDGPVLLFHVRGEN